MRCPQCKGSCVDSSQGAAVVCVRCNGRGIVPDETKTVSLYHWEQGFLYPHNEWECYSYSEYDRSGIPKFAEIRRLNKNQEN